MLNTFSSSFDTVLGVYTGTNVAALTPVASNDDSDDVVRQSQVAFSAIGGVAYQIAVDGYGPQDAGNIVFRLSFSNAIPIIAVQPASQRVLVGSSIVLSVSALGVGPLHYQWRFNEVDLIGSTSDLYGIRNVGLENAGRYSVVVANAFGSVTSAVAVLSVDTTPNIIRPPASQVVIAGEPVVFSVEATGTEPLSYQWQFNRTNISGAFLPELRIDHAQPNQAGRYSVVVSNPYASLTNIVATLEVHYAIRLSTNGIGRIEINPS